MYTVSQKIGPLATKMMNHEPFFLRHTVETNYMKPKHQCELMYCIHI